ncbi:MAG: hypothetical protein UX85_C0003G0100 [Candidatus Beckwithbacteria bacterium GW2011_GWB1_47_15]|uniref:Uncharacterized protein n=1 Tax=Candidatus Beckwithbacteria bacterium GW2011_GWB1_47_15 TaxID=1618371 RepID=A0A0G1RWD8_9BACT|nr:MAG: hypothetical protein UY43_C0001G0363 [Candidatus Beckwithbacteria bacterium GW2011_GWC1_49_16]KKU35346.1 MAG: hypothetical protein UX50_C0004G0077 [Candidatus Beckwithbacteria bacterium GW2011_GWA1_46_30]KKU61441.1 MAG: hypothetical protein UX85_C0003G0100 [Candidatus Beckwithbacteria bacterium GW2011_GWB1_47_15]KKU71848.1 MAG: hypothetical protein UX97_C0003G0077 [Candidatus Beckwithbacteria bacterium GW2011_GWA2_47_25]KKW03742.1 MAG: hypothetical protein UY37_C0004G0035 [Candidatus Be
MKSKLFLVVLGAIFGLSLLVAKDRVLADELCPGGTCLGESVLDVYDYCKAHQSENWCVQYYARDTVTCGALTCRYSKFSLGPNVKCISEDISINPECDGTTFEMQAGSCCSNDPGGGSGGSCPAAAGVPGSLTISPSNGSTTEPDGDGNITVSWSSDSNGKADVWNYEIYPAGTSCSNPLAYCSQLVGRDNRSKTFTSAADTYFARVQGVNVSCSIQPGPWSSTTFFVGEPLGDISGTVYLLGDGSTASQVGFCQLDPGSSASPLNLGTNVTVSNPGNYTGTVGGGGNYTVADVPAGGAYTVTLDPSTYTCACPSGTCQYGGVSSPQAGVDFYLTDLADAWWQAEGGNLHADGGSVSSNIPASCAGLCSPYLVTEDASGTTGLVSYTGSLVTGSGDISQDGNDWNAKTQYKGLETKYAYFARILEDDPEEASVWDGSEPGASGVYAASGSTATFGGDWSIGSGTAAVILVDGDVTIAQNINVDEGGFLAIIASGNISVNSAVTNVEGVYIADGVIATGTTGTGDEQLIAEGIFTGWGGFNLERDLDSGNNNEAAEYFIYRPDLQVNAYQYLTRSKYRWEEVAP